jgi:hypothetical protein
MLDSTTTKAATNMLLVVLLSLACDVVQTATATAAAGIAIAVQ